MKRTSNYFRLIAVFLLTFLVVVGITIWLLDFVAQQRIFGFLISAEFVAFALLVYLYYEENPQDISKKLLLSGFAALGVLVLLGAAVFMGVGSAPKPNVSVTVYSGKISTSLYGFGNSATSITSPGPTLTFKVGDVVNMTLVNVDNQMSHNWAIVNANKTSASVLFHAQIASGTFPLTTNQTGSVIFTVTKSGNFYYICQVAGHVQLGMWGSVVINP
ncbi:MAG: multicopper oxidase domain-containing protein [Candidatus Bathyarchaeia archaeon]|jgi:plastocyanin